MEEFFSSESSAIKIETSFMNKIFIWMFVALIITGISAFAVASSDTIFMAIYGNNVTLIGLLILELALVIVLSSCIMKMNYLTAVIGFIAYSIINGITLSGIFLLYTYSSIAIVFFIAAGLFGLMAVIGYTTKMDLTKIGNLAMMGLLGIIIASVVNLFIKSSALILGISIIGVIIFIGLTAYDVQKIKRMSQSVSEDKKTNLSIICALTLYLDFINLFLKLLRLMGKRKN